MDNEKADIDDYKKKEAKGKKESSFVFSGSMAEGGPRGEEMSRRS